MLSDVDTILALLEAFDILEVFEKLTPGSDAFEIAYKKTLGWIEELGPDKALEKIRVNKEMLKSKIYHINEFNLTFVLKDL